MNKVIPKKSIKNTPNLAGANEANIDPSVDKNELVSQHNSLTQTIPAMGLGGRMRARFAAIGGIELELPSRAGTPRFATFD